MRAPLTKPAKPAKPAKPIRLSGTITWIYPFGLKEDGVPVTQAFDRKTKIYAECVFGQLDTGAPCVYRITIRKKPLAAWWMTAENGGLIEVPRIGLDADGLTVTGQWVEGGSVCDMRLVLKARK
jgi:hypothetical protein